MEFSQVIPILKPGKPPEEVQSYRPISLLPVLSKVFEKLLITRIQPTLQDKQIIPDQPFGFRKKHATTKQVHRIVNIIHDAQESDQYCTASFLDISQAFDKVWHQDLLYKINTIFPDNIDNILQSYLHNRYFLIRYREAYTSLHPVSSGVPHGSVLGPLLYLLYNPLPVQFKALLHGQKGCVFFSGHLNLRTTPETGLPSREKNYNN